MENAGLGNRVARIEGIMEEIRNRLNHLESSHRSDFRTLLWVQIASWATITAAIIGLIAALLTKL